MINPWLVNIPGHPGCQYCCANDRMDLVRRTSDLKLLEQIIAWPETQRTVHAAAESKLRRLKKAQTHNDPCEMACIMTGKCTDVTRADILRARRFGWRKEAREVRAEVLQRFGKGVPA